jgi:hypothetical protein
MSPLLCDENSQSLSPDTSLVYQQIRVFVSSLFSAERPASILVPRESSITPFDLGTADEGPESLEALIDVAKCLHFALITAQNTEERREVKFL